MRFARHGPISTCLYREARTMLTRLAGKLIARVLGIDRIDPANIDAMLQIISEEGARLTQPR